MPLHLRNFSPKFSAAPRSPLTTPQPTGAARAVPWLPAAGTPGHVAQGVSMEEERYRAMMAALLCEWHAAEAGRDAKAVQVEALR